MKYIGGLIVAVLALAFLIGWTWIVFDAAMKLLAGMPIQYVLVGVPVALYIACMPWLWIGKKIKE